MNLYFLFLYPIFVLFLTIFSLNILIGFLNKKGILDIPQKRSNHSKPKPKCAGFIIVPIIIVSIFFFIYLDLIPSEPWEYISYIALVLFLTSFLDDIYNLPSSLRLFIQIVSIILAIQLFDSNISDFIEIFFSELDWFSNKDSLKIIIKIVLIFMWLWITNLFNFMDGIDGITASQTITFSLGITLLSFNSELLLEFKYIGLIFFSSILGFLYWNQPPAKIFLGDCGSIPIGFLIGGICILSLINLNNFVPTMILLLYYVIDSSLTLANRIVKKKNIFTAHSEHFYQKKVRNGWSHKEVLLKITITNSILIIFALLYGKYKLPILICSILLVLSLLFWLSKKKS